MIAKMYLVASIVLATLSTVLAILPRYYMCSRGDHTVGSTSDATKGLSDGSHAAMYKVLHCIQLGSDQVVCRAHKVLHRATKAGVKNASAPLLTIVLSGVLTTGQVILTRILPVVLTTGHVILTRILTGVLPVVLTTIWVISIIVWHVIHLFYYSYLFFTEAMASSPSKHNQSNSSR
jgi:hypothetical protein